MKVNKIVFYIIVISIVFLCIGPFVWLLITSLKTNQEIYSLPVTYIPENISLGAYREVFANKKFLIYVVNSVIVSAVTTIACLCIALLAAYGIARIKMRHKRLLEFSLLLVTLFPQIIFLVPLYTLMAKLHVLNHPLGLVIPYVAFSLPLAVWVLVGFFKTIPRELEEQAMIDGLSNFKILTKIIIPLSWPGIATAAILIFIGPFAWNEFLFSLSFMIQDSSRTVPVGIAMLSGSSMYETPWNQICAAVVMTTIPLILFVLAFQKRIVEGLTKGAVKG
ncbi:carbohydrate ABC transporter permease [Candidatus Auribacterota bacterium]